MQAQTIVKSLLILLTTWHDTNKRNATHLQKTHLSCIQSSSQDSEISGVSIPWHVPTNKYWFRDSVWWRLSGAIGS